MKRTLHCLEYNATLTNNFIRMLMKYLFVEFRTGLFLVCEIKLRAPLRTLKGHNFARGCPKLRTRIKSDSPKAVCKYIYIWEPLNRS